MANRDAPFGFRPRFHLTGGVIRPQKYYIASGYNKDIFSGDLAIMINTTRRISVDDSGPIGGTATLGAFAGVNYRDSDGNQVFRKSWTASTATLGSEDAVALVYDDPFIIYEGQSDAAVALADIGLLADVLYAAGSHVTGQSAATITTASSNDFKIYDLVRSEDNEVNAANNRLLVLLNLQHYNLSSASSGYISL